MFRTLEVIHISSMNERLRLVPIPTANWPTPLRPVIMPIRHKNVRLARHIRVDHGADIAHRNGEGALPAGAHGARICPLILQGVFGTLDRGVAVVVVACGIVRTQGGLDEVLDCDTGVGALVELVCPGWYVHPSPLMRVQG